MSREKQRFALTRVREMCFHAAAAAATVSTAEIYTSLVVPVRVSRPREIRVACTSRYRYTGFPFSFSFLPYTLAWSVSFIKKKILKNTSDGHAYTRFVRVSARRRCRPPAVVFVINTRSSSAPLDAPVRLVVLCTTRPRESYAAGKITVAGRTRTRGRRGGVVVTRATVLILFRFVHASYGEIAIKRVRRARMLL